MTHNPHIGSSLDDFLREEGILNETRRLALTDLLIHLYAGNQEDALAFLSAPNPMLEGHSPNDLMAADIFPPVEALVAAMSDASPSACGCVEPGMRSSQLKRPE